MYQDFSFLWPNNIPLYEYHILVIYSSDGHVGCLYLLAIMNNAATIISVQVFVWMYVFISLGYIPRSESDGSHVNCNVVLFFFL